MIKRFSIVIAVIAISTLVALKLGVRPQSLPLSTTVAVATPSAPDVPQGATAPAPDDLTAIKWETNDSEPTIGSEKAIRGGTVTVQLESFPLTFRLYGPNSNDGFANWSREYSLDIGLVDRHPITDHFVPVLATQWSVQDDHKTIYYKLDPDARWSDGTPITADDYLFAAEFRRSPLIVDPFSNRYMEDYIEEVKKIDDLTIKVVGKKPSWRPLDDYNFSPLPKHATQLDAKWVERENNKPPVVQGPYVISSFKEGDRVEFSRVPNWWGDKKRYFTGMFNPDKIILRVISDDDLEFDLFKKHELDIFTVLSALRWNTEMNFDALNNGWVHQKRVFVDTPQGLSGIALNPNYGPLQNKDFRKGLQHLFNFEELNKNLMYNSYYRQHSMFTGTAYENKSLTGYPYDPRKARDFFAKAGFDKRGPDGILVNSRGERASFTLVYSAKSFERHLTVVRNSYQKGGVDLKLQFLDSSAAFSKLLEKSFQASVVSMTAGFYPDPHEYFSSEFKGVKQNNNFWDYGNPEVDKLIDVYRFDMDETHRKEAMAKLDEILADESLMILFWQSPFTRLLHWDDIEFPDYYLPKRSDTFLDYQIFWVNPEKRAKLEKALKDKTPYQPDTAIDVDAYGVKKSLSQTAAPTSPK